MYGLDEDDVFRVVCCECGSDELLVEGEDPSEHNCQMCAGPLQRED